jgi:peptidylprolyl isomerase
LNSHQRSAKKIPPPPPPARKVSITDSGVQRKNVQTYRTAEARGRKERPIKDGRRFAARLSLAASLILVCALAGVVVLQRTPEAAANGAETKSPVACGAQKPPAARPSLYATAPQRGLKKGFNYSAVVHTSCGDFEMDLLEGKAPVAVNNFVFLAQQGFYNGLIWTQTTPNFIIQAGDPDGDNGHLPDGAGYVIPDELPADNKVYTFGAVGMASVGPDSASSQFFAVVHDFKGAVKGDSKPLPIDPKYTIFGRVLEKYFGSLQNIASQERQGGQDPLKAEQPKIPVFIESVEIVASSSRGKP